jgi:hypothetical protein
MGWVIGKAMLHLPRVVELLPTGNLGTLGIGPCQSDAEGAAGRSYQLPLLHWPLPLPLPPAAPPPPGAATPPPGAAALLLSPLRLLASVRRVLPLVRRVAFLPWPLLGGGAGGGAFVVVVVVVDLQQERLYLPQVSVTVVQVEVVVVVGTQVVVLVEVPPASADPVIPVSIAKGMKAATIMAGNIVRIFLSGNRDKVITFLV